MKRGISDIIAVVLMIAVAIAIGVFVTTFVTKWVSDQTTSTTINCAIKTNYVVDDVKFNFSGDDILIVKITNKGDQELYGFGFVLENLTKIVTFRSDNMFIIDQVMEAAPIGREESVLVKINLTNSTIAFLDNVSHSYSVLAITATKLTVRNDACTAVPASTRTINIYP